MNQAENLRSLLAEPGALVLPGCYDALTARLIERAVDNMTELIESLLLLARGGTRAQPEDVALRGCAEEAAEPFREMLAGKPVKLEIAIEPDVRVYADRQALGLVLSNLIKNAVDNTATGSITIRYAPGRVEVVDTGCGIRPDEIPKIFKRFYRAGPGGTGNRGLGLAIVKRVSDEYNWRVSVNSRVGVGTQAIVELNTH